jgi:hypothetical protein
MALDWLIRTCAPAWLRHAGLDKEAALLEVLDELTPGNNEAAENASEAAEIARIAAWEAIRATRRRSDSPPWAVVGSAGAWAAKGAWDASEVFVANAPEEEVEEIAAWYIAADAGKEAIEAAQAAVVVGGPFFAQVVLELRDSACALLDRMMGV